MRLARSLDNIGGLREAKRLQSRRTVASKRGVFVLVPTRDVPTSDIATGACVRRPCYGMTFGPATHLAAAVARVAEAARPYTCLNWRSEAVSLQYMAHCAGPRRHQRRGAPRLTG